MADASTIAKAYVQLVPSFKGVSAAISKELGGSTATAGAGKSLGSGLVSGIKSAVSSANLPSSVTSALGTVGSAASTVLGAAGKTAGAAFSVGVKATAATAKAAGAALATSAAAGAAALAGLTTSAVSEYADFEQNVGGVQKLFGDSAQTVVENARNAYAAAGVDQNTYMEQVTSFSASLISSLGGDTAKAAEYANTALEDMSDNANTYGTNIEDIQNAYQGFAKQNYTMLDNLKLGYGGTQSEMERLVQDAAAVDGSIDATSLSFDNCVAAIHVMQQQMGISGTTSREAATTISGSIGMMRAAWTNWLSVLAEPGGDISGYTENLMSSVTTVIENVMPAVQNVLQGVAAALPQAMASITAIITTYFPTLLPVVVEGLTSILTSVASALPQLIQVIADFLPTLAASVGTVLQSVVDALWAAWPTVVSAVTEALPQIIEGAVSFLTENVGTVTEAGVELFCGLVEAVAQALPTIIEALPQIIEGMVSAFAEHIPDMMQAGVDLLMGLADGILNAIPNLLATAMSAAGQLLDGIKSFFGIHSPSRVFAGLGGYMMEGLGEGIESGAGAAVSAMDAACSDVLGAADMGAAVKLSAAGAASGLSKQGGAAAGAVYNVYINDAQVNGDAAIRARVLGLFEDLDRMGAI